MSSEKYIKVEISRVLCSYDYKPFTLTCFSHEIKRAFDKFPTLAGLKNYYQIEKLIKTGKTEWAISSRGKRHEWPIYEAYISEDYVM